jgi:hypothetical protein
MKFFIRPAVSGKLNDVRMGRQIFGLRVSNLVPAFTFAPDGENWLQENL